MGIIVFQSNRLLSNFPLYWESTFTLTSPSDFFEVCRKWNGFYTEPSPRSHQFARGPCFQNIEGNTLSRLGIIIESRLLVENLTKSIYLVEHYRLTDMAENSFVDDGKRC